MELTFNLDEPVGDPPPGDAPPGNKKPPSSGKEPPPRKHSRLPLIGHLPASFQLQVLAAAFLIFLAAAGFVSVMDSRAATYGVAHLGVVGEIGVLTERIARLAPPAAAGSVPAVSELQATRARQGHLIDLLDSGGEFDGAPLPAVGAALRPALEIVRGRWKALAAVAAPTDFAVSAASGYPALRDAVAQLHAAAVTALGKRSGHMALVAALGSSSMLMLVLFFRVFNDDAAARQALAEHQRRVAEMENADTQGVVNLLKMEIINLAEGDLTARASVGRNITGAIAEAVNYAIDELSVLVGRINEAATRVTAAASAAERTSEELLAASETQSKGIRTAGGQVLSMARSMNEASGKAEESAKVALSALDAANKGAAAVADSIAGMDEIRGQIQETSKRIKRLGESSQEVGEIVELISDITEQTNVLALNAAIQAASAGEAGRGFGVVAEEVQRLAERSADAARRVAVLVKTIQADTHDAVSAMETSTQGVIEGAHLSDAAGRALADISTVSRQLAGLIEGISADTKQQAEIATRVAQAMRDILRITEQTSAGTRSTAVSINELAELAVELKASVAGFKVG